MGNRPSFDSQLSESTFAKDDLKNDPWLTHRRTEQKGAPPAFEPHEVVELGPIRYELGKAPLGRGSYGVVWAGKDIDSGKVFAIKVMRMNSTMHARAKSSELRVFVAIRDMCSSNELPCLRHYVEYDDESIVIVMDFIEGIRGDRVKVHPNSDLIRLLQLTTRPLAELHSRSVSHGDIKPDNVLVITGHAGRPVSVALIDFGLSCSIASLQRDPKSCVSRVKPENLPVHMDPAFIDGISNRFQSDIFSLGVMFEGWIRRSIQPGTHWNLSVALRALVSRMKRSSPTLRPTAAEVAARLDVLLWSPGTHVRVGKDHDVTIVRLIAAGSGGVVFEVSGESQNFALKVVSTRGSARRSAVRELRTLQSLQQAGACSSGKVACLVAFEDSFERHELRMLMRYVQGSTLADRQPRKRKLKLCLGAAEALSEMHAAGVAHLDVKGSNFLVSADKRAVTITDFGLACSSRLNAEDPGLCAFKFPRPKHADPPTRMAPELFSEGGASNMFKVDVYSLGALFQSFGRGTIPRSLIKQMMSPHFTDRPSLPEVVTWLNMQIQARAPAPDRRAK